MCTCRKHPWQQRPVFVCSGRGARVLAGGARATRSWALIAEHYMTGAALTKAGNLLDRISLNSVAGWADD